jgi:hypothetical protein
MSKRWPALVIAIVLLAPGAGSAAGKCDDGGEHGAAVAVARETVRSARATAPAPRATPPTSRARGP